MRPFLVKGLKKRTKTSMEEDIITIHLGKVLPKEQYDSVVASVIEFLNTNWKHIFTLPN